jgi:hypothetical protein
MLYHVFPLFSCKVIVTAMDGSLFVYRALPLYVTALPELPIVAPELAIESGTIALSIKSSFGKLSFAKAAPGSMQTISITDMSNNEIFFIISSS